MRATLEFYLSSRCKKRTLLRACATYTPNKLIKTPSFDILDKKENPSNILTFDNFLPQSLFIAGAQDKTLQCK